MTQKAGQLASDLRRTKAGTLGNPLDFLADDHLRQRQLADLIDRVSGEDRPDPESLESVRALLREELPLHYADEDEGLFPMLRRRAAPEDEIGLTLDRLSADHRDAVPMIRRALRAIDRVLGAPGAFREEERESLRAFAGHERRHLIVENAIVLPLARARLTRSDITQLRRQMLKRRGLDRLLENDPC